MPLPMGDGGKRLSFRYDQHWGRVLRSSMRSVPRQS